MRIGLISQEYPPETGHGGIGTQTFAKAHGLASFGHEVFVVSHSLDERTTQYMDGLVHVTRVPGFDSRLPLYTEAARWLTYSAQIASAVWQRHLTSGLDIVEFPDWGGEGYIHLLNRTEWNYLPTVVHVHGPVVMLAHTIGWPDLNSDFYRTAFQMEAVSLRLANRVYSSSKCSADWCARGYGLDASRIPIIHAGVDTNRFRPGLAPKERDLTIVFVGKIARNKGVEELVEAACSLREEFPDLRLRLFGSGDEVYVNQLREIAIRCGTAGVLDIRGFIDPGNLPGQLSRAHVFAAPSHYEGGPGFVYLEAMACGLPVIACSGSGASEIIRDGHTGFLVPPGDTSALSNSLRRLLADPIERSEMGNRARDFVTAEADSNVCLRRIEAFYAETLAGSGQARTS